MNEYYCENCESFGKDLVCQCCGMEFIEPEWSKQRAVDEFEKLSEESNLKLLETLSK